MFIVFIFAGNSVRLMKFAQSSDSFGLTVDKRDAKYYMNE